MAEAIISRRGGAGGAVIKINVTSSDYKGTQRTLSVPRYGLAATSDGNGSVLFAGGAGGNSNSIRYSTVDVYHTDGSYSCLKRSSNGCDLAAATDGQNAWFGGGSIGSTSYVSSVDKFNPDGTRTTYQLSVARDRIAAAADGNGNVWFAGGYNYTSGASSYERNTVDRFSQTGTRSTYTLTNTRYCLAGTHDGNGNVLFGGGLSGSSQQTNVNKFSPDGTRTTLNLSAGGSYLAAATDGQGNAWFGGGTYEPYRGVWNDNVDKITPSGQITTYHLSQARSHLAAATDGEGNILFGGGSADNADYSDIVDKFLTDGTRTTYQMSLARHSLAAATDGYGRVWFGGGSCDHSLSESGYQFTSSIDVFGYDKNFSVFPGSVLKKPDGQTETFNAHKTYCPKTAGTYELTIKSAEY